MIQSFIPGTFQKVGKTRLTRNFGPSGQKVFALGIGTIWFGKPWPPNNPQYTFPPFDEVRNYLDQVYKLLVSVEAKIMLDTASQYGSSEEKIGQYFKEKPDLFLQTLIATKWGGSYDAITGNEIIDYSKENLINSVNQSISLLGRVDLLYFHGVGSPDNVLSALRDTAVVEKMERLRREQIGGIRYLGVSISNEQVLETAIRENLFQIFDVIQLPAWLFTGRQDLTHRLQSQGLTIVLNSPVRWGKSKTPQEIYTQLLDYPEVASILTGTRHHLAETLGYLELDQPQTESAPEPVAVKQEVKTPEPQVSIQELVRECQARISIQDTKAGLQVVFNTLRNIFARGLYGEHGSLPDILIQDDYKSSIADLVKISWQNKDRQDYLEDLNYIGQLFDMAYLLSCVQDSQGDQVWEGLKKFYDKSLNLNQLIPRSRLFAKGSFASFFDKDKIYNLFKLSHEWLFDFVSLLLKERCGIQDQEFNHITNIGLTNIKPKNLKFIFQYYRPGEIAGIVKEGFGKPQRYEQNFDPDQEGLTDYPILGIHYLINDKVMYVLEEIKKRQDMKGIICPTYSLIKDPSLNIDEQVIGIKSGLFYDQQGKLTLAEFTRHVREDYSVVHVRDKRITDIRQVGVPTPFSPILGALSYAKQTHNQFYTDSNLPFPIQTAWPLERTKQTGNSQLHGIIKQHLINFVQENNLARVYIKPGKGYIGAGVKNYILRKSPHDRYFDEQVLEQAIDHIVNLGDDAIIQAEIIKLDFRALLQESIDLGHATGSVDNLLQEIFGHPVDPASKLDWVIRYMVARRPADATPFVAARRIIVNDQGVANTGKGGKIINIEGWVPQLTKYLSEYDSIVEESIVYATKFAEDNYTDEVGPLDGSSAHETELSIIDGIIDPQYKMTLIEVDHSFVPNMWRVDIDRAGWGQLVLDRVSRRMRNYRAALGVSNQKYPYSTYRVNSIINKHIQDPHNFKAQTEIFDALKETYIQPKDEQIIVKRIQQARAEGQEVVVGFGGLGIAGIGPSILQAAAEKIIDTSQLKNFIQNFYHQHISHAPAQIADALWRLYVISEEKSLSVSQVKGALTQLREAEGLICAKESDSQREKLHGQEAKRAEQILYESLQKYDDFRDAVNQIIEKSAKQPIFSVFAVQPLSPPPGHGYFVGLVNHAIFPHGINDGGLKTILPKAHPRLYATPSRKAAEYADIIIVTISLDVEPSEPGKYKVAFGPLIKEIEDFAQPLGQGIKNAQQEGRKPTTVIVVTTQGPGTSKMLIKALEKGLKKVSGQNYKCGRDFYFVHAPSNIDPGENWVNSLSKTPQPISGFNHESIQAGIKFFNSYNHNIKVYRGPQSLEQVEYFKVFHNVCAANNIANAIMGAHGASLIGASFQEIRDHIHDIAGMGKVRKLDGISTHNLLPAEASVGSPCLYKESEIIQTLGLIDPDAFGHSPGLFTDFLTKAVDTAIITLMSASRQLNEFQPYYVAGLIFGALEKKNLALQTANIAIAGIAYKRNMGGDTRHTPAFDVLMGLLGDPLHLRAKPCNFKAAYSYLISHDIPQITMVDPDVSYFREVDQRSQVPNITGLATQNEQAIQAIPVLAKKAKEFLIKHQSSLNKAVDKDSLHALDPQVDQNLIDYIADFFFLSERGPQIQTAWQTLADSTIQHDIWQGLQDKDTLVLCLGYQFFKECIQDLPRLAKTLRTKIIIDTFNFLDKNMIQEWQALGGVYMGVGIANPLISYLEQDMADKRDGAQELLLAKKQGDTNSMQDILNGLQQNLSIDIITNHAGLLPEKQALLKVHQGIKPQELDWQTWYYIGGKYYLAGKDQQEVEATKQVFK